MLVQFYAIKTIEEAQQAMQAGADRFGVVVGEAGKTPDETNFEQTSRIFAATPPPFSKMALTVETDIDAIEAMVRATGPDILHLSGDIRRLPVAGVRALRERLPGIQIVQAIPVSGPSAIELALAYAPAIDVCFLDTQDPGVEVIGATGAVHDWNISRQIVQQVGGACHPGGRPVTRERGRGHPRRAAVGRGLELAHQRAGHVEEGSGEDEAIRGGGQGR